MKHIDFDFNGETYALSFTADALFRVYDKFGVCDDILSATHALEPTEEGWVNCCWLAALMASQGEYQRRHMGELPRPMLTLEQLRTGFMAADSIRLRLAVRDALIQGFEHEESESAEEVDEILKQREEAEKKTNPLPSFAGTIWRSVLRSSHSR